MVSSDLMGLCSPHPSHTIRLHILCLLAVLCLLLYHKPQRLNINWHSVHSSPASSSPPLSSLKPPLIYSSIYSHLISYPFFCLYMVQALTTVQWLFFFWKRSYYYILHSSHSLCVKEILHFITYVFFGEINMFCCVQSGYFYSFTAKQAVIEP